MRKVEAKQGQTLNLWGLAAGFWYHGQDMTPGDSPNIGVSTEVSEPSNRSPAGEVGSPKHFRWKRLIGWAGAGALVSVLLLFMLGFRSSVRFEFNSSLIETVWQTGGSSTQRVSLRRAKDYVALGVRSIGGATREPDLDQLEEVARYVFNHIPSHATVYPSEGFFYFRFKLSSGREIWGNFRVAELNEGRIWIAYFDPLDPQVRYRTFDASDGLQVQVIRPFEWAVTWHGRTVRFDLPVGRTPPDSGVPLLGSEVVAGNVIDESGVAFTLIFNTKLNGMYFLRDPRVSDQDNLQMVGPQTFLGQRSGFCYFRDPALKRDVLIGVYSANAQANNYFDGPGDQVPYWIDLRRYLYLAYPHTMRGKGVDVHGVVIGSAEWARVAVSPYIRYARMTECIARVAQTSHLQDADQRMIALTKEWWNDPEWLRGVILDLAEEGKHLLAWPSSGMAIVGLPGPDGKVLQREQESQLGVLNWFIPLIPPSVVDAPVPSMDAENGKKLPFVGFGG